MRKCLEFLNCPIHIINKLAPATYQDLRVQVLNGTKQKIDYLIKNGAPVYSRGQTILHFCISQKNIDILKKFCNQYPGLIDERNDDGDSPFMMAIFQNFRQGIQYLIKKCNINICDNNGNTAFIIAAANGDIQTLKLLLNKKKQSCYVKNFQGQNALHRACYYGQILTVKFLLQKTNLKLALKDQKGNTSLHFACQGMSFGVAKYIVRKVVNWKQLLLVKNKNQMDPFDLMSESVNKITDKTISFTKQGLEIAVVGEVVQREVQNVKLLEEDIQI